MKVHSTRADGRWSRSRILLVLTALIGLVTAASIGGSALANTALGNLFELDGNAVDNAASSAIDWQNLYNGPVAGFDFTGIVADVPATDATYFTGGGSKDPLDIPNWQYNGNSAPAKDEITDAYGAAVFNNGGKTLYFGADRYDNSGDSQIGFWFFQNSVTLNSNGTFSGVHQAPDATHPYGDLLVLSDFTNGGRIGTINVYEWVGSGGSDGAIDHIFPDPNTTPVVDCQDPAASDDVCGTVNTGDNVVSPWPYKNKSKQTTFAHGEFYEGGINLGALLPAGNPCFASFLAETRSSQSPSAVLKDFVLHSFEPCVPSTTMSATAATASPSVVHANETTTLTFYETNDGNVALTTPSVTTDDSGCSATIAYASGDANNDGKLSPGETWVFTCTTSFTTAGSKTVTAVGHGTSILGDVTFCPTADTTKVCDADEKTTVGVTVINPSTELTKTATALITYTFKERNTGDTALSSPTLSDPNCSSTPAYSGGDDNSNSKLDPGETWVFTCSQTLNGPTGDTGTASVTNTGIGHGNDSASTSKDVTWCTNPASPPAGVYCSQQERDRVTVTIENLARG